jgi:hypothetical protein
MPEGGHELDRLVTRDIPAAMAPRLEPSQLAAAGEPPLPGCSAVVVVSGKGIGRSRIAVLLHAGGDRYSVVLASAGGTLPPGLSRGLDGLDAQPPNVPEGDRVGREWLRDAAATITRAATELRDDHRWWGDVGSLIMLADLVEEGASGR